MSYSGGSWPNRAQEDLLHAAVLPPHEALDAFRNWRARPESHDIDVGSYRVLPQVYRNLEGLLPDDSLRALLRGIYRREWVAGRVLQHAAAPVVRDLHAAGIDVMLLKGAALLASLPPGSVVRPMDDIDLLVHPDSFRRAAAILRSHGFETAHDGMHHLRFRRPSTTVLIELHVTPLKRALDDRTRWNGWDDAQPAMFGDTPVFVGSAADQLLHTCVHGLDWNPLAPIRWVVDGHFIVSRMDVDWDVLVRSTRDLRAHIQMVRALTYLRDFFHAAVPDTVIEALRQTRYDVEASLTFLAGTIRNRPAAALLLPWRYTRQYQRWKRAMRLRGEPVGLARFAAQAVDGIGGRSPIGLIRKVGTDIGFVRTKS